MTGSVGGLLFLCLLVGLFLINMIYWDPFSVKVPRNLKIMETLQQSKLLKINLKYYSAVENLSVETTFTAVVWSIMT